VRTILVIGIGMGHPDQLTVQAIDAMRRVDVFFAMDKATNRSDDGDPAELVRVRRELCNHHLAGRPYRFVTIEDPPRERDAHVYRDAVESWHAARVDRYERALAEELGPDGCGGILAWGDPSLYDSTLRILEQIAARGTTTFSVEVVPGISSAQLLAARHRIVLNRVGGSVLVTTGRNLAAGLPAGVDDVVVMLDGSCAFTHLDHDAWDIHWGAYLGTDDELLVAGRLAAVADDIVRVRDDARRRKGWVMDTYLLRRRTGLLRRRATSREDVTGT
jgi:precorrin-6A synthase